MAAIAATSDARQTLSADQRVNLPARSAAGPALVSPSATDDEILGLTTNVRRKDSRGAQVPTEAAREAQNLDQLELDFAREDRRRNGKTSPNACASATQNAAQDGDAETISDPAGTAAEAHAAATAANAAEPAHLQSALEANPELRAAWHDTNAYRETSATPEEARAATGMLADLNHMDALFFSHRPEDHAQLARAVAELDPVAFASLARAMTQVAQTAGATFPAIAARTTLSPVPSKDAAPAAETRRPVTQPRNDGKCKSRSLAPLKMTTVKPWRTTSSLPTLL